MYTVIRDQSHGQTKMQQHCVEGLEYLTFPLLDETGMVGHLFTTRMGGVSTGDCASLNLSFGRGEAQEVVLENYRRVCRILEVPCERAVASMQTHTTNIRYVEEKDCGMGVTRKQEYQDVDGLVTDVPRVILVCLFADCVPLYFVDPVHRAIGLAHSGWRGTVAGMGRHMVEKMQHCFGTRPEDLVVAIGPSICRECYEVSEDVAEEFQAVFPAAGIVLPGREKGKFQLDLWEANRRVLTESGVRERNIALTDICTCHNPGYLFSHRASRGKRGNLGAFLYILEGERDDKYFSL